MFTLIIGGAASGKSVYAERLTERLPGRRVYLATMYPWDEECKRRIQNHQNRRLGMDYLTIERYTDLAGLTLPENANVLMECLSNLLANERYTPEGGGDAAVTAGVLSLHQRCRHLTVVTNEVFSGGADYSPETLDYLRALAGINRTLAQRADRVIEVVAGLPVFWKGAREP